MKPSVLLFALAACTSAPARPDAAIAIDAPKLVDAMADVAVDTPNVDLPDLTCLGHASPATAPDPLPVTGKLFAVDHYQVSPFTGGTVVLHRRANDAAIAQATTAADGSFAMSIASGGVPVDAYFTIAATSYRATRFDPGDPLSGGEDQLTLIAHDDEVARWYGDAGATYTPGVRTLITASVDCRRSALGDSTITTAPVEAVTYYNDPVKQWDPALAASTNGFSLVPSAPASITATAHYHASIFSPFPIAVAPGALTIAVLTPHTH